MTQKSLAAALALLHEEEVTTTQEHAQKKLKAEFEEIDQNISVVLRDQNVTSVESLREDLRGHLSQENFDLPPQVLEQRGQIKREEGRIEWVGNQPE